MIIIDDAIAAAKEALTIWRMKLELELKRLLLDEQDKIDSETEDLRARYDKAFESARTSGNTDDLRIAERLRDRLNQKIEFGAFVTDRLSNFGKGTDDSNSSGDIPTQNQ